MLAVALTRRSRLEDSLLLLLVVNHRQYSEATALCLQFIRLLSFYIIHVLRDLYMQN